MTADERMLTIPMNGGLNDDAVDEVIELPSVRTSRNTRLSVEGGALIKSPYMGSSYIAAPGGASLVPLKRKQSTAVYPALDTSQHFAQNVNDGIVRSPLNAGWRQNAYAPLQMVNSGGVPISLVQGPAAAVLPAVASVVHDGKLFVASVVGTISSGPAYSLWVEVSVTDIETNAVVVPPTKIAETASTSAVLLQGCVGFTVHGKNNPVVMLWYLNGTGGLTDWMVRAVGLWPGVGSYTVVGPFDVYDSSTSNFAVTSGGEDGYGDETYAWLSCGKTSDNTKTRVMRVALSTGLPVDSGTDISVAPGNSWQVIAIDQREISGTKYVAVGIMQATGEAHHYLFTQGSSSMTQLFSASEVTANDPYPVAVKVYKFSSTKLGSVLAVQEVVGGIGTTADTRTTFFFRSTAGSLRDTVALSWWQLYGQGMSWTTPSGNVIPLFALNRVYDLTPTADEAEFVEDPAICLFAPCLYDTTNDEWVMTPVARFGVDQCEAQTRPFQLGNVQGDTLVAAYLANAQATARNQNGNVFRYVVIDMAAKACRVAHDDEGVALIAAALTSYWDGYETVEVGPLHKPRIAMNISGGSSGSNYTGDLAFAAVYVWMDAQGQKHRSAPSTVVGGTAAAQRPIVYVQRPHSQSMRNGISQHDMAIELYFQSPARDYFTLLANSTYRLMPNAPDTGYGTASFDGISGGDRDDNAALYTAADDGSGELPPAAPPPSWDVAVIGRRAWLIDAENRSRAVYSKIKQRGVFFEFPAEFEILFPSSAGKLMAITEVDGLPVFLAENGAWAVGGVGPSDTGEGEDFAEPQRINDVGCASRDSVVRTPVGTIYASRSGFAMLGGGGAARVWPHIDVASLGVIVGAVMYEAFKEVVFFGNGSGTRSELVYNFEHDRWTEWDHRPAFQHAALFDEGAEQHALVSYTEPGNNAKDQRVGRLLSTDIDYSRKIVWETGYVMPAGAQGSCVARELMVQGVYDNDEPHGLQVTVVQDYADGTSASTTTQEWSSNELEDSAFSSGRYTLVMRLKQQQTRAVKITVTETAGGQSNPGSFKGLSVTLVYSTDGKTERRFRKSAIK